MGATHEPRRIRLRHFLPSIGGWIMIGDRAVAIGFTIIFLLIVTGVLA
jgi:hypothetical protein